MLDLADKLLLTLRAVIPIAVVIAGFQAFALRRPVPRLPRVATGFAYVLIGFTLLLVGLERALFPLGKLMARQLTDPGFLGLDPEQATAWHGYAWVYAFAAAIGFATTIAEPALRVVAQKARDISGDTISASGLRVAVAIGVAVGIALGAFRIVTGTPLHQYIIVGYVLVVLQTAHAPRAIVPLAYDSGGVTTSTMTVPLVAALGLGLANAIPGRDPLLDGFGLVAFASLVPIMTVMGYAQLGEWRARRAAAAETQEPPACTSS
jgi:hypothetical protein